MRKALVIGCLLLWAGSSRADLRERTLVLVDSAYAEAVEGRLENAISINLDALDIVPEDSLALRCECYSCLLYCYHRLGNYREALRYGELCLQFDEKQGTPQDLSASLGNLAGIYSSAGQQDVAENYLLRAIDIENTLIATEQDYTPKSLAVRKAMLGEVLLAKSKNQCVAEQKNTLAQALQLTEEALAIDRALERRLQEGMRLAQLGHIYEAMGESQLAKHCTEEALAIARETGNKMTEVLCLLQLGNYREAAARASLFGFKKQEFEACDRLYKDAKQAGRSTEALQWLERARELYMVLQNDETQRQLTAAHVEYDTYRKEQQIAEQKRVLESNRKRIRLFIAFSVLSLILLCLLVTIVVLLRRNKNELEKKVIDREQQYAKLAQELRLFYGKDIATLLRDIADAKAKNMSETTLTKREQEVVRYICEGLRGKEIADKMNISIRAVNSHKTNIFNKLGITSSVELVRFALEHGII